MVEIRIRGRMEGGFGNHVTCSDGLIPQCLEVLFRRGCENDRGTPA
jgi:hypothetical protein